MADVTALNAAVAALTDQVAATETVEASAKAAFEGFGAQIQAAVSAALTADNAADQGSIDAANAAIAGVTARFVASAAALGAAIPSGTTA